MEDVEFENSVVFAELEKKLFRLVCELGCAILKSILEQYDMTLMKERNKKEYRHKGYKQNCIKTLMGDVEYKRAIYLHGTGKSKKHVYLLDKAIQLETIGKISFGMAEKMLTTTVNAVSYRKRC